MGTTTKTCTVCAGTGYQADVSGSSWFRNTKKLCPTCGGSGTVTVKK